MMNRWPTSWHIGRPEVAQFPSVCLSSLSCSVCGSANTEQSHMACSLGSAWIEPTKPLGDENRLFNYEDPPAGHQLRPVRAQRPSSQDLLEGSGVLIDVKYKISIMELQYMELLFNSLAPFCAYKPVCPVTVCNRCLFSAA